MNSRCKLGANFYKYEIDPFPMEKFLGPEGFPRCSPQAPPDPRAPVAAEDHAAKKRRIDPLADPHCAKWYSKLSDKKKENVRKAIAGETTQLDLSWCGEHRSFEPDAYFVLMFPTS